MYAVKVLNIDTAESGDVFNGADNQSARYNFFMKVYAFLCLCVICSTIHISLVMSFPVIRSFMFQHMYIIWILLFSCLIINIVVSWCLPILQKRIAVLLLLIMLVESLTVIRTLTMVYYETHIIRAAVVGTFILSSMITVAALFVPVDMTKFKFFGAALIASIFFLAICTTITNFLLVQPLLQLVIAFVKLKVFSIHLTYINQMILGDKTCHFVEGDFLGASIFVYFDIVLIYLQLLYVFNYFK